MSFFPSLPTHVIQYNYLTILLFNLFKSFAPIIEVFFFFVWYDENYEKYGKNTISCNGVEIDK